MKMLLGIHYNHNVMETTFHEGVKITNKVQRKKSILQIGVVKKGETVDSLVREPAHFGL